MTKGSMTPTKAEDMAATPPAERPLTDSCVASASSQIGLVNGLDGPDSTHCLGVLGETGLKWPFMRIIESNMTRSATDDVPREVRTRLEGLAAIDAAMKGTT